jgi:uncharacterized iron-regulated membrane protein
MSEEWIAGLITVTFIVGLIAWVPFLSGLSRCVSALIRASDRQADRYPWRDAHSHSGRSEGTEEQKVFRSS